MPTIEEINQRVANTTTRLNTEVTPKYEDMTSSSHSAATSAAAAAASATEAANAKQLISDTYLPQVQTAVQEATEAKEAAVSAKEDTIQAKADTIEAKTQAETFATNAATNAATASAYSVEAAESARKAEKAFNDLTRVWKKETTVIGRGTPQEREVSYYEDDYFTTKLFVESNLYKGKVYTVKVVNDATGYSTPSGNDSVQPLDDLVASSTDPNIPAIPIPTRAYITATGQSYGEDRSQEHLAFKHWMCNFVDDDNGVRRITAIEGDPMFSLDRDKDGYPVDVGELYCKLYIRNQQTPYKEGYNANDETYTYMYISITTDLDNVHDEEKKVQFKPFSACVRPDGSVAPYFCFAKYPNTMVDGKPYSQNGPTRNSISYNTQHTMYEDKDSAAYKGPGYHAVTMDMMLYAQLMILMKYRTKNSQTYFYGNGGQWNTLGSGPRFGAPDQPDGTSERSNKFYVSSAETAVGLIYSSVNIAKSTNTAAKMLASYDYTTGKNNVLWALDEDGTVWTDYNRRYLQTTQDDTMKNNSRAWATTGSSAFLLDPDDKPYLGEQVTGRVQKTNSYGESVFELTLGTVKEDRYFSVWPEAVDMSEVSQFDGKFLYWLSMRRATTRKNSDGFVHCFGVADLNQSQYRNYIPWRSLTENPWTTTSTGSYYPLYTTLDTERQLTNGSGQKLYWDSETGQQTTVDTGKPIYNAASTSILNTATNTTIYATEALYNRIQQIIANNGASGMYDANGNEILYAFVPIVGRQRTVVNTYFLSHGVARAGATDLIPGNNDGYLYSSGNSSHPFRLQGLELGHGAMVVPGNILMDLVGSTLYMRVAPKGGQGSVLSSDHGTTNLNNIRNNYTAVACPHRTNGYTSVIVPNYEVGVWTSGSVTNGSDAKYYCDYWYTGGSTSALYQLGLWGSSFHYGGDNVFYGYYTYGGVSFLSAAFTASSASWYFLSRG